MFMFMMLMYVFMKVLGLLGGVFLRGLLLGDLLGGGLLLGPSRDHVLEGSCNRNDDLARHVDDRDQANSCRY